MGYSKTGLENILQNKLVTISVSRALSIESLEQSAPIGLQGQKFGSVIDCERMKMRFYQDFFKLLLIAGLFLGALTGSGVAQSCNIDIVVATQSGNGIAEIPSPDGATAFALSTDNVGSTCNIVVSTVVLTNGQPASNPTANLCQTNPQNASCFNPSTPTGTVSVTPFDAGEEPTFSVFLQASGTIPSGTEVCVIFSDQNNHNDGSKCVPVETT